MKNSFRQLNKPLFNHTFQLDKKNVLLKKIIIKNKSKNNNFISNYASKSNLLTNKYFLRKNYSQRINLHRKKNINDFNNSFANDSNTKMNEVDNKIKFRNSNCTNKNTSAIQLNNNNSKIKNIVNSSLNDNNVSNVSMGNLNIRIPEEAKTKLENSINSKINLNKNNSSINNESSNPTNNIKLPKLFNSKKKTKRKIPFLIKSSSTKITSNDIYLHYLKEDENDKNKIYTLYDFIKYLNNNHKRFNYGLDKIYGNSKSFIKRMNEIKKNKCIAKKNDFYIEDYQKTMLKLLKKHINEKYLNNLEKSYKVFDNKNFGLLIPNGRYINLAYKLKDFLSKDIFENMKKLDKNYKLYVEKKKELKEKSSLELEQKDKFYEELDEYLENLEKNKKNKTKY
jgi:hypothetical protein